MKQLGLTLAIVMIACPVHAQENKTSGGCSPIVVNNNGTLDIHCTGLDPAVAKQISLIVNQISSIKRNMATEATQQQMLQILVDVQRQLDGLNAQRPKPMAFSPSEIGDFISAFKEANSGASLQGIDVEVVYEFKARNVGETLLQALREAGVPAHASMSQDINFFGAERGIFGTYVGERLRAEHVLNAIAVGLSKAGVIDSKLSLIATTPISTGPTSIQLLIKN